MPAALILLGAVEFSFTVQAVDYLVANVSQFNSVVTLAVPGDTITLANGNWTNASLLFKGNGTASSPITLRAQTGGQVLLTGSSRLRLAGSWLVASGLTFTNGYPTAADVISFQENVSVLATNCRVSDCAILDFNTPNTSTDTKWVSIYGFSNRVDHCYFRGKRNNGTLLVVWLPAANTPEATKPNYHQIDYNWFGPRPVLGGNGGEIIRVGDSSTSFNVSHTILERNLFSACDGEIEIVSSKSCENVYRYNTFVECAGTLTLRHGNRCRVEGNYFLGNNKASTGGVRIMGEDHTVFNNYFQDLGGSAGYSALTMMQGLENSPLDGYFQVKNAVVAFNTLVNCSNSLIVGLEAMLSRNGTNYQTTLPPLNCTIANNVVSTTKRKLVDQRITPINLTWQGNIMFGTDLGIPPNEGIRLADPNLVQGSDRLWQPGSGSPALGAAQGQYNFATEDIRGRVRPAIGKDVSCDQVCNSPVIRGPLSSADVGPSWIHPLTVSISAVSQPAVSLRWPCVSGAVYQVLAASDLVTWTNASLPITAASATQTWEETLTPIPSSPTGTRLYRVKRLSGATSPPYAVSLTVTNRPTVSLQWNCIPGAAYQVQVSTNLSTWQNLGPPITNADRTQIWQEVLAAVPGILSRARFYRIRQLP